MIRQKSLLLLPLVTMLLFAFTLTLQAQANDEERMRESYAKCVKHLKSIADRCMNSMDVHSDKCGKRVEEALHNGQFDRAAEIAEKCEKQLTSAAHDCTVKIDILRKRCAEILEGSIWEKPLHEAADSIIRHVNSERDVAIKSVCDQLRE